MRLEWNGENFTDRTSDYAEGGSGGKLYIYDIGDMALPRETEYADLQRTIASMVGGGGGTVQTNGIADGDATRSVNGR